MTGRLDGRIALVCGASSGIGRAIAERFTAEGAEVWGLARNGDALESMDLAGSLVFDLDDLDALEAGLADFPPAVLLVNNTGGPPGARFWTPRPMNSERPSVVTSWPPMSWSGAFFPT